MTTFADRFREIELALKSLAAEFLAANYYANAADVLAELTKVIQLQHKCEVHCSTEPELDLPAETAPPRPFSAAGVNLESPPGFYWYRRRHKDLELFHIDVKDRITRLRVSDDVLIFDKVMDSIAQLRNTGTFVAIHEPPEPAITQVADCRRCACGDVCLVATTLYTRYGVTHSELTCRPNNVDPPPARP